MWSCRTAPASLFLLIDESGETRAIFDSEEHFRRVTAGKIFVGCRLYEYVMKREIENR